VFVPLVLNFRVSYLSDYSNIQIPNAIQIVNLIFEYSFVLINILIGLNRATILAFAA